MPVVQFFMETQARPLFEFFVTAIHVTIVRMVLGVRADMLLKILLLSEISSANFAYKSLEPNVQGDQMSL